jgi:hypothetical protein
VNDYLAIPEEPAYGQLVIALQFLIAGQASLIHLQHNMHRGKESLPQRTSSVRFLVFH